MTNYAKKYGYAESQRPPWAGIEPKEASDHDSMPPAPSSIAPIEEESRKPDARTVVHSPARISADANAPSDADAGVEEPMFDVEQTMMDTRAINVEHVRCVQIPLYSGALFVCEVGCSDG